MLLSKKQNVSHSGHESFAAAEGAIGIANSANKVRNKDLRVILMVLVKAFNKIISRINGFTYVQTKFDYYTGELNIANETAYSDGPRAKVRCYGADDVREGVAIMHKEGVDVSLSQVTQQPNKIPTSLLQEHTRKNAYKKVKILLSSKRRRYRKNTSS